MGNEWSHDSKILLLAFSGSRQLTALHLIGPAYSLKAQLLPVEIPGCDTKLEVDGTTGKTCNPEKSELNIICQNFKHDQRSLVCKLFELGIKEAYQSKLNVNGQDQVGCPTLGTISVAWRNVIFRTVLVLGTKLQARHACM